MKRLLACVVLASASAFAWAVPTLQQVETEVQAGRYAQAETMMGEVVAAKGDSAKAHYVYAEVLAHNGKFAQAAEQAKRARQIDPDIKFTSADKFRSFEQTLQREQAPVAARNSVVTSPAVVPARVQTVERSGFPSWIWIAVLAAIAFFLWRGFARSRAAATPAAFGPMAGGTGMGMSGPSSAMPYGPGYPPPAGGGGAGLLGTGLAVAGGVAGGMALDRLLHSHEGGGSSSNNFGSADGGGFDSSGSAARELESRPVDFGSGNDWDSGGSSGEVGGGSDGGGGWD